MVGSYLGQFVVQTVVAETIAKDSPDTGVATAFGPSAASGGGKMRANFGPLAGSQRAISQALPESAATLPLALGRLCATMPVKR
jgi:hypothetical protein